MVENLKKTNLIEVVLDIYENQTILGRKFGFSAVKLGKKLEEFGLKKGQLATKKANDERYAIVVEYNKRYYSSNRNYRPVYNWNVAKIEKLFEENGILKIKRFQYEDSCLKALEGLKKTWRYSGVSFDRNLWPNLVNPIIFNHYLNFWKDKKNKRNIALVKGIDPEEWIIDKDPVKFTRSLHTIESTVELISEVNFQCSSNYYMFRTNQTEFLIYFGNPDNAMLFKLKY